MRSPGNLLCSALVFVTGSVLAYSSQGQDASPSDAVRTMKTAAEYYYRQVAVHGGYVYHYSLDLQQRWGEGLAAKDQIWVQPPGTPTVGEAFLRAFEATADEFYLKAATDAATALIYGQLKSGGWTNSIDFDPKSPHVADYRNGRGRGKNNSSLDDDQTTAALRFLMQADRAHQFKHSAIHQAAASGLEALLAAQYANGAFPQVWTGPVPSGQPTIRSSFPDYDWRTEGRVKDYWNMYTLNDNVTGNVADTLLLAAEIYQDPKYLDALKRLGDFLLLAQLPAPQPGWAQQYGFDMKPIWARKFEPPAVASDETQEVLATLMKIAQVTKDAKYLQPIKAANQWLRESKLSDGQLARYYELKSNRPLYMERNGEKYSLTYDDTNLPDHYGWKIAYRGDELQAMYTRLVAGKPLEPTNASAGKIDEIIRSLDSTGRWINTHQGERLVGQPKIAVGSRYLSSQTLSDHLIALARFVRDSKSPQ